MAQQIGLSRERALLVRAYLVNRYRLEPMTVGGIGLGSQPTKGSHHATWNGFAIVFVHGGALEQLAHGFSARQVGFTMRSIGRRLTGATGR